jgi:mRNA interferase RelE/StbE
VSREILLSSRAQEEFVRAESQIRERIRDALNQLATTGHGDVRRLKGVRGGQDLFRLRVGSYRIVFELANDQIRVTRIVRRSEGYGWL